MGNVTSRPDEDASLYIRDQNRLSVSSVKITTSKNRVSYHILPNATPASKYSIARESDDDGLVEYVQDPESSAPNGLPTFLPRLEYDEELKFDFTFSVRQGNTAASPDLASTDADTVIKGLTFIFAPTTRDLDTLVTREFNADPNLHKNPNVDLVGDFSTVGKTSENFEWSWKWRPPKGAEDKGGGWRTSCSFVEYDQRAHRLNTLVTFSFWVKGTDRPSQTSSLRNGADNEAGPQRKPHSPTTTIPNDTLLPPRIRYPSSQSIDSKLSDSDNEPAQPREPPSPFEPIPEQEPQDFPLEPSLTANTAVKVDLNCQPNEDDVTASEDGPLFRATIKALESKTGSVRQRMKKMIKKAEYAKDQQIVCNLANAGFIEALREASSSNANAVQPAIDHYFQNIAKEILSFEKRNAENLSKLIIDPLSKIYGNDIKQAEAKKKDFEDESRDYYAYVGRYLGQRQDSMKEKKRVESDSKYENKRKNFELKRFDYSAFMQDLHGGRKDQEVLSQLTKYADAQARGYLSAAKKIEGMLPQLEALSFEVREADKQYQLLRTGREEKRRALEKSQKGNLEDGAFMADPESAPSTAQTSATLVERPRSGVPIGANGVTNAVTSDPGSTTPSQPHPMLSTSSPGMDRYKGIRDLESKDEGEAKNTQRRKEGLLWSLSRPGSHADPKGLNKQAWHKFWVVLDQGRLSEYVNWKQSVEQHGTPIDLRMASVREARNSERRFCFEVITPHYTRVYQATGEDDMRSWIGAINNALQSAMEARTPPSVDPSPTTTSKPSGGSSLAQSLFGKSSSYHGHRNSSAAYLSAKNVNRHATVGERPPLTRSRSSEDRPAQLLNSIRTADEGNRWCADCNSESRVEWVSINLGLIVCIECSGIHRSLGTHISKIRSLTLDTHSFTQDIVELILSLGNRVSNMIWEAKLDQSQKPPPGATRDQRLSFITAKYAQRAFVEPLSPTFAHTTTPDDTLLTSIKKNDMQNVYHALALSANPNSTDRSRKTHAVFLALVAADPAAPGTLPSTPTAVSQPTDPRKSFPLAELLLQNGADLPTLPAPIPLSKSAMGFVEFKKQPRQGLTAAAPQNNQAESTASSRPNSWRDSGSGFGGGGGGGGGGIWTGGGQIGFGGGSGGQSTGFGGGQSQAQQLPGSPNMPYATPERETSRREGSNKLMKRGSVGHSMKMGKGLGGGGIGGG
ncbi:MAG: hypothetical protein M1831_003843 [Alyxoria varia]|nr:MAG: hypothetical protein M1831_003843 [Alyxoria varia]